MVEAALTNPGWLEVTANLTGQLYANLRPENALSRDKQWQKASNQELY